MRRRRTLSEDEELEEEEREGWRITKEMMDRVHGSKWLRNELADGGLRQLIYDIDIADETEEAKGGSKKRKRNWNTMGCIPEMTAREMALEKAKLSNGKFATFLDKLLLEAGVLRKHANETEEEEEALLSSFLNREENLGPLSLVPIVKKKQRMDSSPAVQKKLEKEDMESSAEGEDNISSSSSDEESTSSSSSSSSD